MKPACCIRLRDLIAETDLRRRMSVRSFPGIDRRVIPRWFAQVRRSLKIALPYWEDVAYWPVVRDLLAYPDAVYYYL